MKTKFNFKLIRKCLILVVMIIGLVFVASNNNLTQLVTAHAPCEQECEELKSMCIDNCAGAWGCDANSSDATCNSCLSSCDGEYNSCMASAIWCGDYGPTYEPNCQVGYGNHCPIISGSADCTHPSAHAGYYLVCKTLGSNQCVRCPDHDYCVGSNGLQSCP